MQATIEEKPKITRKAIYQPFDHQLAIHNSLARIKVVCMPARSGKDICMLAEMVWYMQAMRPIWENRPDTMNPKWHIWLIAPTYKLAEQLWLDCLNYVPKEWWDGPPKNHEKKLFIRGKGYKLSENRDEITHGLVEVRSADNPDWLVATPVDWAGITEAALCKPDTWPLVRFRLTSPDRFEYSRAFLNSTPQGQYDLKDPEALQHFWAMVMDGRNPENHTRIQSFYWFEDRANYGNIEHPILSRSDVGRAEMDEVRNDPNISERDFRQNLLGECLPAISGRPVVKGFEPSIYVGEFEINKRLKLYRTWDFGRNYPAVKFHQITEDNQWRQIAEYVPILQDMIDVKLGQNVKDYTEHLFPNFNNDLIRDRGDFEAVQKTDNRVDNTLEALAKIGISMEVTPTKTGDEGLAINILNARISTRHDGTPNILIHPRCVLSIRCFSGMWMYEMGKVQNIEYVRESVAELHPWIDIFDADKYFIVNVLEPETSTGFTIPKKKAPKGKLKIDPVTKMEYYG